MRQTKLKRKATRKASRGPQKRSGSILDRFEMLKAAEADRELELEFADENPDGIRKSQNF